MSALQTNINTLMSANSVDELKSRLVAILTTVVSDPLIYEALLTQTGTDAPVITVLENNTGITWTASYDDVGNYFLTPSVEPDDDKIAVYSTNGSSTGSISAYWRAGVVNIGTKDGTGTPDDGVLNNSSILIRIRP